ncbi:hypothetical protein M885DRAFT_619690 [Pelagophyceae sp. CCMP2097]|nr:hypothetical protein M885DRAFT_619690 [Pelagophyceae sp. CCMP2097]
MTRLGRAGLVSPKCRFDSGPWESSELGPAPMLESASQATLPPVPPAAEEDGEEGDLVQDRAQVKEAAHRLQVKEAQTAAAARPQRRTFGGAAAVVPRAAAVVVAAPAPKVEARVCRWASDVDALKQFEVRLELEARHLDSKGTRSVVSARLKAALPRDDAAAFEPPTKPTNVVVVLSNFEAAPIAHRLAYGSTMTLRVDAGEHGAVEYNLVCARANAADAAQTVFEAPPMVRGGSYEHAFDDVGAFIVSDAVFQGVEVRVEVFAITGMKELRLAAAARRNARDADVLRQRAAVAADVLRAGAAQREREAARATAADEAAAAEIRNEKADRGLRQRNEEARAQVVHESMLMQRQAKQERQAARAAQAPRRRGADAVQAETSEPPGEPPEPRADSKFSRLRGLVAEARELHADAPAAGAAPPPEPELLAPRAARDRHFFSPTHQSHNAAAAASYAAAAAAREMHHAAAAYDDADDADDAPRGAVDEYQSPPNTPPGRARAVDEYQSPPNTPPGRTRAAASTEDDQHPPSLATPAAASPRVPRRAAATKARSDVDGAEEAPAQSPRTKPAAAGVPRSPRAKPAAPGAARSPRAPPATAGPARCTILESRWTPAEANLRAGEAIEFKVDDGEMGMVEYVLVCESGGVRLFGTDVLARGGAFSFTFEQPGSYVVFDDDDLESRLDVTVTD